MPLSKSLKVFSTDKLSQINYAKISILPNVFSCAPIITKTSHISTVFWSAFDCIRVANDSE